MSSEFSKSIFYGYLIKGDLTGAISYLRQFDALRERYQKYMTVFDKEEYPTFEIDSDLNEILLIYQKYYREVFYLGIEAEQAAQQMRRSTQGICQPTKICLRRIWNIGPSWWN